ncbi:MAG: hypothetical protein KDJ44_12430 [Rhodoblastus sp.]|nr:hypothetical protein [Rhodoblastus sp.]
MRKQSRSFTVEVKRRPTSLTKKPVFAEPSPSIPAPPAAALVFAAAEPAPNAVEEAQRRILPCLVTEAAIDAAKAVEETEEAIAPRRRGRPRKQQSADDLAPLAPRKRGRPRKIPLEAREQAQSPSAPAPQPVRVVQTVPAAPVGASVRSNARRAAVSELPRSERWKRRLPKTLR